MKSTQIDRKIRREKTKLSVQYAMVTLVIVVLLMVSFYVIYARNLYASFDASIAQRAASLAAVLSSREELTPETLKSMNLSQNPFQASNEVIEITDAKGTILFSSAETAAVKIVITPGSFSSGTYPEDVNNQTTLVKMRAYTSPVEQHTYYVSVARTYDEIDAALGGIASSFLMTIPFVVLLTGLVSYKLAGLAIRPIEESYRELKQFTEDASHELKTPLAAIKANIDVALSKNVVEMEYYRKKLSVINESVGRMVHITESLLYLSRLDNQGVENRRESIDVHALLEESREHFVDAARQRAVALEVADFGRLEAQTNREVLEEIVAILVENAVNFNRPGGKVTLAARSARDAIELSIADTGIGIAREDLPRIFDRFYRAEKSRSRATGGTGLGLAITRDLAELIGAHIQVESQEGVGSVFTVVISQSARKSGGK
ncbi:MAG: sensor histidine kinase [Candidatus Cryosericum sp.]